ncbi:MAG: glycosyltransferase family 39 protein [Elusimicrobia bacterium]|nr:glycosyltransferase family 39 protein [Elusimicrobiota bacterium]
MQIAGGYAALSRKDYHFQGFDHPPLAEMVSAAWLSMAGRSHPLVFDPAGRAYLDHLIYEVADRLIYGSSIPHDLITAAGRWSGCLVFFPVLAVSLFIFAERCRPGSGVYAVGLLCIEPNLLAHAALATKDFPSAALLTASTLLTLIWADRPSAKVSFLLGVSSAALSLTKYTNLLFFPVALLLLWLVRKRLSTKHFRGAALAAASFAAMFTLVYQGIDWHFYQEGLTATLRRLDAGRGSFFFGDYSPTGWLLYYPALLLLKTNISHLVLAVAGAVILGRNLLRRGALARAKDNGYLIACLLMPVAFFFVTSVSKIQIGHRYILPAYPFIVVLAGAGLKELLSRTRKIQAVAVVLVLAGLVSTARCSPYFLSYFNELAGGPSKAHRYFTDSSVDWGQGLAALARWLKDRGAGAIYLSYFGSGDPGAYGIRHVPVGAVGNVARTADASPALTEKRLYLAVSVTNFQSTYYSRKGVFDFLRDRRPEALIAYSILIYDITDDGMLRERVAKLLNDVGHKDEARQLASLKR